MTVTKDFFEKHLELCEAIQKAVRLRYFNTIYLFFPERAERQGCKLNDDLLGILKPNSVEDFIKEGCRLFFRTKLKLLREYARDNNEIWSKSYRFELATPFKGYSIVEGSPFVPPSSFYEASITRLALKIYSASDLEWLGSKRPFSFEELEFSSAEKVVSVTFMELCLTLFGVYFLDFHPSFDCLSISYNQRSSPLYRKEGLLASLLKGEIDKDTSSEYMKTVISKATSKSSQQPSLYVISGETVQKEILTTDRRKNFTREFDILNNIGNRFTLYGESYLDAVITTELRGANLKRKLSGSLPFWDFQLKPYEDTSRDIFIDNVFYEPELLVVNKIVIALHNKVMHIKASVRPKASYSLEYLS